MFVLGGLVSRVWAVVSATVGPHRAGHRTSHGIASLDHLERMAAIEDDHVPKEKDDDDFLRDSAEQLAAKRARLAQLKELLTSTMLGTA